MVFTSVINASSGEFLTFYKELFKLPAMFFCDLWRRESPNGEIILKHCKYYFRSFVQKNLENLKSFMILYINVDILLYLIFCLKTRLVVDEVNVSLPEKRLNDIFFK